MNMFIALFLNMLLTSNSILIDRMKTAAVNTSAPQDSHVNYNCRTLSVLSFKFP